MEKYIDKKAIVSTILAVIILFFMQKWFTKKFTTKTGEEKLLVGHDTVGHL